MLNSLRFLLVPLLVFCIVGSGIVVSAENITIPDGRDNSYSWHGVEEDQEVEPGNLHGQQWDHEAFLKSGSELSMVSGFDILNGVLSGGMLYTSGDIFFDINGDYGQTTYVQPSNGHKTVNDRFGYEYVADLDLSSANSDGSYNYIIWGLNDDSMLETAYYKQNQTSNPWKYDSEGVQVDSGTFNISDGLTAAGTEAVVGETFVGDIHYIFDGLDLGFLNGREFWVHSTMSCGNDNLIGYAPVPEPASILLLVIGLAGLGICRKMGKC